MSVYECMCNCVQLDLLYRSMFALCTGVLEFSAGPDMLSACDGVVAAEHIGHNIQPTKKRSGLQRSLASTREHSGKANRRFILPHHVRVPWALVVIMALTLLPGRAALIE